MAGRRRLRQERARLERHAHLQRNARGQQRFEPISACYATRLLGITASGATRPEASS